MSSRPIYVDLDDVLCETARGFLALLEREFGRRIAFDQIHSFDLGVSFGLAPAELEHFFELAHRPALLADLQPIPGAVETVRSWVAAGHEVAVVTGRPPRTAAVSREWLARHGVPCSELTFVDKYGRSPADGPESVLPLSALGEGAYRLAVEDSLSTAYALQRKRIPVLLFDRPWNQGALDGALRCRGWDEVRRRVGEIVAAPADRIAGSAGPMPS